MRSARQSSWHSGRGAGKSIFSMARAASFMLMLEPHDRHVSTQVPLLPPESPQPLEPSLSCILRRCSGKNPASVLCIITLDRPDELLDCTVLYYHNSILSASCRGHPTEPTTNGCRGCCLPVFVMFRTVSACDEGREKGFLAYRTIRARAAFASLRF